MKIILSFSGQSLNGDLILTASRAGTGFASTATDSNGAAAGAVLDSIQNPSGDMAFAYNSYDGSRHIDFPGINRVARSDYNGQQYSALVDFGYIIDAGKFKVTPIASAQYLYLHIGDYTERDAGALDLALGSQNYDMFQTGFGAKFEYPLKMKYGTLVPELHFKWLYDFIGDRMATTSAFSGGGGSFATTGFTPAQSMWDFGGKLNLITKNNVTINVNYDYQLKEDYYEHTGWLEIRYRI